MNMNDLKTIVTKAVELDNANKYEWIDDAVEDASKATGIALEEDAKARAVRAVQLTLEGYDKIDYFIEHGFTMA